MIGCMDGHLLEQACFHCRFFGQNDRSHIGRPGHLGQCEATPNPPQGAIQSELPHAQDAFDWTRFDLFRGRQDAEGERQVICGTFLAQSGWSEIDGDALSRPSKPQVLNGAFDALLAFSHCTVWQADHEKVDSAVHADLHSDGHSINALQGGGMESDEQIRCRPQAQCTSIQSIKAWMH